MSILKSARSVQTIIQVGYHRCDAEGFANTSQTDTDHDWDYQPGNNTWACRGVQTGQYADLDNCAYDIKDDDRWPS